MKIAVYSCHSFEKMYIRNANTEDYNLLLIEETLSADTIGKAKGCGAISIFSSDKTDREMLERLNEMQIRLVATRSAGTDHINLKAAQELGIKVSNVPEYSPNAIAEHCIALTLALYRKLKPSFQRITNYNFSLESHVGQEINSKIVGICGTGDIGERLAKLFYGFGAKLLLFDAKENPNLKNKDWAKYVSKESLLKQCDIISLNLPLTEDTEEFIGAEELKAIKDSSILVNAGRGGLINTKQVYKALREKKLAGFAMDVYENEKGIFYNDLSEANQGQRDNLLESLIALDNVVVTAHQAFLTDTALKNMMETTFESIRNFDEGLPMRNVITNKEY
ncbi:MAG: NAD(P)-dependent oxidoreductase [Pricia sp.]